jgi:hypothetical protein
MPSDQAPPSHATLKLAAIGTLAGIFSGLFGVGGGTVIVLGAVAQGGIYGNVHVLTGLLLAIPAVLGVVMGTAIQQRIPQRAVSLLFAVLLVAVAIELILR